MPRPPFRGPLTPACPQVVDRALAELSALEQTLAAMEGGRADAAVLGDVWARLHAVAELAVLVNEPWVEELAREAETLTVGCLAQPQVYGSPDPDVFRHVLDALAVLLCASRLDDSVRRSDALLGVAVAARERVRYTRRALRTSRSTARPCS